MIKSLMLTSGLESWRKHAKTVGGRIPEISPSQLLCHSLLLLSVQIPKWSAALSLLCWPHGRFFIKLISVSPAMPRQVYV